MVIVLVRNLKTQLLCDFLDYICLMRRNFGENFVEIKQICSIIFKISKIYWHNQTSLSGNNKTSVNYKNYFNLET